MLFSSCRATACKRKKITSFDITLETIRNLWSKQQGKCYYTGIEMILIARQKIPSQVSIDRIDSEKGYTIKNTVLCCQAINFCKNDYTPAQFNEFLEKITHNIKLSCNISNSFSYNCMTNII